MALNQSYGLAYHLERRRQEAEAAEHELVNDFSDVDLQRELQHDRIDVTRDEVK